MSTELLSLKDELLKAFPDKPEEKPAETEKKEPKEKEEVIEGLLEEQLIVRVSEDLIYEKKVVDTLQEEVREMIKANNGMTMNDFRDRYGLSRKFTIALLDYFDRIKFTRRVGEKRLLF